MTPSMTDSLTHSGKPSTAPDGNLTGHIYDDIQEYDNPTPGWWHAIFVATIVFSIGYLLVWDVSIMGSSISEDWEGDQRAEFARIFGTVGALNHDQQTILAQTQNPQFMAMAKGLFIGNCAACHKRDGGGDVGVNLCDDSYKSVKHVEDLFRIITDGAAGGAMPAWKNRISDNERVVLAAYVASLRGTKPNGGKPPEGEVIAPWPAPSPNPTAPPSPANK
ncbi:MAG: c-type cytochrome [Phycisphaerales bacterium]|nr:c-type cytochrome [Phycisphaerales bacterium]